MDDEHTLLRHGDQQRRWYATREWYCSGGELTCVRTYIPYEVASRKSSSKMSDHNSSRLGTVQNVDGPNKGDHYETNHTR
jgi:hypothetical protein